MSFRLSARGKLAALCLSLAVTGATLVACGTGATDADDADAPDGPPQTLEEAAARFRDAAFKIRFEVEVTGEFAITFAQRGSQARFDLHGDDDASLTFFVDGQSAIGCVVERSQVDCTASAPEGEGAFWGAFVSAMFMVLLDADALAHLERVDLLDVTATHAETILGHDAMCFDLLLTTEEDDNQSPPQQAVSCFGAGGEPLRIGYEVDEGILPVTATSIEQPTDADFVPPVPVTE